MIYYPILRYLVFKECYALLLFSQQLFHNNKSASLLSDKKMNYKLSITNRKIKIHKTQLQFIMRDAYFSLLNIIIFITNVIVCIVKLIF